MFTSTCWSYGGPEFGSWHLQGSSQPSTTPVPEELMPFSAPEGTAHTWCTDTQADKTPIHIK